MPVTEVQTSLCFGATNRERRNDSYDLEKATGIPTAVEIDDLDLTLAGGLLLCPPLLPLFATGLGVLGWRRKRKAQAVA